MALSDTKSIVPRAGNEGTLGTAAKAWGQLFIDNPASQSAPAATISNRTVDQVALDITGLNTTANVVDVSANQVTTGAALNIETGALTGAGLGGRAINLDINDSATTSGNTTVLAIDYNKTGVLGSSQSTVVKGIDIDIHDAATNNAAALAIYSGISNTIDVDNNTGIIGAYGFTNKILDVDTSVLWGIHQTVEDGGVDIRLVSSANNGDYFDIITGANAETTLRTIDADAAVAHLNFDVDGDIRFYKTSNTSDFLTLAIDANGGAKFTTVDAAAAAADFEIEADGEIILDCSDKFSVEQGTNVLEFDNGFLTIDMGSGTGGLTAESSQQAPYLTMRCTGTGTNGRDLGRIMWQGDDNAGNQLTQCQILGETANATDTNETGRMSLQVTEYDGTLTTGLTLEGSTATDGEINATIGAGAASVTTVKGDLHLEGDNMTTAGAFTLASASGAVAIQSATDATVNCRNLTLQNITSSHGSFLNITDTVNSTAERTAINFTKDKGAAGADGDSIWGIHGWADNAAQELTEFTSITGGIITAADTDEAGGLSLKVTTSNGTTSALQNGLLAVGHGTNNDVDVTLGYGDTSITTITGDANVTSKLIAKTRKFEVSSATDGDYGGDVVYFGGTTSMTTGAIYHYKSDGTWELADADQASTCDGLLGVALGAASDTNGVLLRGMVTIDHDPGAVGDVLYVSTTAGDCSATAPSGTGDIVRIIGYQVSHASNGNIWFNPDNTFVEIS